MSTNPFDDGEGKNTRQMRIPLQVDDDEDDEMGEMVGPTTASGNYDGFG
jgi:SIT4-associating protein SAP185/190